jgi:hypothetical protein
MARAPWEDDPRLDRSWRERRNLVIGTLIALAFVLIVTIAAAGT